MNILVIYATDRKGSVSNRREIVGQDIWTFVDERHAHLIRGESFDRVILRELTYDDVIHHIEPNLRPDVSISLW